MTTKKPTPTPTPPGEYKTIVLGEHPITLEEVEQSLARVKEKTNLFLSEIEKTPVKDKLPEIKQYFQRSLIGLPIYRTLELEKTFDDIEKILPFVVKELKQYDIQRKGRKARKDTDDRNFESVFHSILNRAYRLSISESIPPSKRVTALPTRLDPVSEMSTQFDELLTPGTLSARIPVERNDCKNNNPVDILYSVSFDKLPKNIKVSKKITYLDDLICDVIAGEKLAGNDFTTISRIYEIVNKTKPYTRNKEEIAAELIKLMSTIITVDNQEEIDNKYNYPLAKAHENYILIRFVESCKRNGQLVDGLIEIIETPYLYRFALARGQISTRSPEVHKSNVSKTEGHLAIEKYLRGRIAHAQPRAGKKKPYQKPKIVLETLYKKLKIEGKTPQYRARGYIKEYLDHFKKVHHILNYKMTLTEIEFEVPPPPEQQILFPDPEKTTTDKQ